MQCYSMFELLRQSDYTCPQSRGSESSVAYCMHYSERDFDAHTRTLHRYLNSKIEIMQLSMVAMNCHKG